MSAQNPDGGKQDILGCSTDPVRALTQPELSQIKNDQPTNPESQRAALWLAITLGRCRLFGVKAENGGVLPIWIAIAAASELLIRLGRLTEKIKKWAAEAEQQESDFLTEELDTVFIFGAWMDFWAALESINEAYQACLETVDETGKQFRHVMSGLIEATQALDEEAENHTDLLCAVTNTELLNNWRSLLVEPYKSLIPWWLDGTLETAAKCQKLRKMANQ